MAEKKKYVPAIPADDKKKALETAISQIEKNHGKGSIMRLGDRQAVMLIRYRQAQYRWTLRLVLAACQRAG